MRKEKASIHTLRTTLSTQRESLNGHSGSAGPTFSEANVAILSYFMNSEEDAIEDESSDSKCRLS